MQRQPQARRGGEPAPRVVVEERLGHGPERELGVLAPAHEDGAEAPRADLQRVGEQHALGRVALAHLDRAERLEDVRRPAEQRRVGGRKPAQLARRRPELGSHPRLVALGVVEHVGAAGVRRGPERVGLGHERPQERLRALGRGVREDIEARERLGAQRAAASRALATSWRRTSASSSSAASGAPSMPGVRSHASRSAARPPGSAARAPASTPAPSRVRASGTRRECPTGIP